MSLTRRIQKQRSRFRDSGLSATYADIKREYI
jgi:hypothetical protein